MSDPQAMRREARSAMDMVGRQLPMWTIYDHPLDFPKEYVARLWRALPTNQPTDYVLRAETLEGLRRIFRDMGLTLLARSPSDDPKIVETWI